MNVVRRDALISHRAHMVGTRSGAVWKHWELLRRWGTELVFEMHFVVLYNVEVSGRMHGLGFGCTRWHRVQACCVLAALLKLSASLR